MTSLVLLRLDYCNSLLSGIPGLLIDKLPRVQDCSARLIFKTSKRTHISSPLAKLHWLPIAQRNNHKIYHFWLNCTGFQSLKEIITKFSPCAMMLSQILPRCTCLISFTFTSLPVHCVPLLTPTSFGFQNERKSSKGSVLSPTSVLSLGIKSPTLYAMLKHNPTSKQSYKPHYSTQFPNQTLRTSLCSQLFTILFPL